MAFDKDRWLRNHLQELGVIDADRVSAKPTTRRCKKCGRSVIACLEGDGPAVPGIRVNVDVIPLTIAGELVAIGAGLGTFSHLGDCLLWRCNITIKAKPASTNRVLVDHRCDDPVASVAPYSPLPLFHEPGALPTPPGLTRRRAAPSDGPPPF